MNAQLIIRPRPQRLDLERRMVDAGMHQLLARLYAARGLSQALGDNAAGLLPPNGLKGIDAAARRIADAIAARERLIIVADYDCDGATACAVGVRGLRGLGAEVGYLVPNRLIDGYGLTATIVDRAIAAGAQLIVTVDNGIASIDGVAHARQRGVDVVVTDHHLPGDALPDAVAIVNPNQPGCQFASKSIAGVGVMFYVLLATRAAMRERGLFDQATQPRLDRLLDLVAVGTVADLVKLDANNRLLVKLGLDKIRAGHAHPGVLALARVAGREPRQLSTLDIGFAVAPRLNAAGRLDDMAIGIECLLADDPGQAFGYAVKLDEMNAERRRMQTEMTDRALTMPAWPQDGKQAAIVTFDPQFHAGVIGLIATKLKDAHHRPAIVFASNADGLLSGSGRSIAGFHLRDAIDAVTKRQPRLIQRFGGHAMAAGLTIHADDLATFEQTFVQIAREWLGDQPQARVVEVDGPLELGYLQPQIAEMLEAEIWGQAFEAPLFHDRWRVVSQRLIKDRHIKATLEKDGRSIDAIAFNRPEPLPTMADCVFRLTPNHWNGMVSAQLVIEYVL